MGAPNNSALNRYLNSQFMNLVMRHCRYPYLYTLHPTFYLYALRFTLIPVPLHPTPYALRFTSTLYALHQKRQRPHLSPLASNLSPFRLIPCQRQCFDADAKQMQERYEVARVKTTEEFKEHYKFDRRERSSMKGSKNIAGRSKNIEIYLVRLSDEG